MDIFAGHDPHAMFVDFCLKLWNGRVRPYALYPAVVATALQARHRAADRDAIVARQSARVRAIVAHAARHVPYYRLIFSSMGLRADDIRAAEDLDQLPLLTRSDLQDLSHFLTADNVDTRLCEVWGTSGTTGRPIRVMRTLEASVQMFARFEGRLPQMGISSSDFTPLGGNYVYISDTEYRPEYRRHSRRMPAFRLSCMEKFDIRPEFHATQTSAIEGIHRLSPVLLQGKPSSMSRLVDYIEELNTDRRFPIRPKAILTAAEQLTEQTRQKLKTAFHCDVFDSYNSTEAGMIGCECRYHDGLHFEDDDIVVEVITDGRRVDPGERGEIVVTDLTNRAMPMLRYRTGDIGSVSYEPCDCGRLYPRIMKIEGRIVDLFVTPKGERFNPFVLLGDLPKLGLKQYQLVQTSLHDVLVRYVGAAEPDVVIGAVRVGITAKMGPDVRIAAERTGTLDVPGKKTRLYVNAIPVDAATGGDKS